MFGSNDPSVMHSRARILLALLACLITGACGSLSDEAPSNHPRESLGYSLERIGELGARGVDRGLEVLPYLRSGSWRDRVEAANTLGLIGYTGAIPALAEALHNRDDWQLAFAAARARGRLGAVDRVTDLRRLARSHWYPPVRRVAQESIELLESGTMPATWPWFGPLFRYDHDAAATCPPPADLRSRVQEGKLHKSTGDRQALQELTYNPSDNFSSQVPRVAMRVDGGWIAGANRGEFGGEVVFIWDSGQTVELYRAGVRDMFLLGGRLVVTTGLAHYSSKRGHLLLVERRGTYQAAPWKRLPGAARKAWLTESGELLVNTFRMGAVLVAADGNMRMADCPAD